MRFWLQIFKSRVYESALFCSDFSVPIGWKAVLVPPGCITHSWLGELLGVLEDLYVLCEVEEGKADGG